MDGRVLLLSAVAVALLPQVACSGTQPNSQQGETADPYDAVRSYRMHDNSEELSSFKAWLTAAYQRFGRELALLHGASRRVDCLSKESTCRRSLGTLEAELMYMR